MPIYLITVDDPELPGVIEVNAASHSPVGSIYDETHFYSEPGEKGDVIVTYQNVQSIWKKPIVQNPNTSEIAKSLHDLANSIQNLVKPGDK